MKLRIFKAGTAEKEVNDFLANHIIIKDQFSFNADGSYQVLYKDKHELGRDLMDDIEQIDGAICIAQKEILAAELGLLEEKALLADTMEKIAASEPNKKREWDALQDKRMHSETQIKMHEDTITTRKKQIELFKEKHQEVISNHEKKQSK